MRLVLDCNVLVAATWSAGTCRRVFFEIIENHTLLVSAEILGEYVRVIAYPKFDKIRSSLKKNHSTLLKTSILMPSLKSPFKLPDSADEIYLDLAYTAKAEAIITGNHKHFPETNYGGVKILSPRNFLNLIEN
jgi:uncharacterized protein